MLRPGQHQWEQRLYSWWPVYSPCLYTLIQLGPPEGRYHHHINFIPGLSQLMSREAEKEVGIEHRVMREKKKKKPLAQDTWVQVPALVILNKWYTSNRLLLCVPSPTPSNQSITKLSILPLKTSNLFPSPPPHSCYPWILSSHSETVNWILSMDVDSGTNLIGNRPF